MAWRRTDSAALPLLSSSAGSGRSSHAGPKLWHLTFHASRTSVAVASRLNEAPFIIFIQCHPGEVVLVGWGFGWFFWQLFDIFFFLKKCSSVLQFHGEVNGTIRHSASHSANLKTFPYAHFSSTLFRRFPEFHSFSLPLRARTTGAIQIWECCPKD